jgi:hypothetical protein
MLFRFRENLPAQRESCRSRSGPAAVIPPLIKGTFAAENATVPMDRDGKAAVKAGEPEDLPKQLLFCTGQV